MSGELGPVDRLLERAMTLAGAWEARARIATTLGQERALLRLFGVSGLDRAGRPLAGEVVDRYFAGGTRRLAGGVALPFAAALLEYDLGAQSLAMEIAAGTIDLGLEAEVLRDAGRRAAAEAEVVRLTAAALDRIAANRIARRELLDVLGDAPRPWIGVPLGEVDAMNARSVLGGLVRDGADLAVVAVPVGRELADRLHNAGVDVPGRRLYERSDVSDLRGPDETEEPPSGSQRGLAILRQAADEAAAERRRYVRLASTAPGLAAPEQAVVAAFERIDLVVADPVAEIVDGRVDPDRALADYSFAHRLHRRAGAHVLVGPGPLVVAPDLARGQPSDPLTRAGRALALQALGVALARHGGLTADQVVIGAFPLWLLDERAPTAIAIAQVAVRRAVFEGHPAAFIEPPRESGDGAGDARWPFVLAATLPYAAGPALILRDASGPGVASATAGARAAVTVAAEVAASSSPTLTGPALTYAQATVTAALRTLERLADLGWRDVLGEAMAGRGRERLGADAVVERVEGFDPLSD